MWIAYDSVVTPSALTLDLGEAPASTTTTTAPTTTTTTGPTTTTSSPDTTTSTGQPDDEISSTTSSTTTPEPDTTSPTGPTDEEPSSTTAPTGGSPDDTKPSDTSGDTTSTTAAVGMGRPGGGPPMIDRGGLVVANSGDMQITVPALPVRVRIGPLEQLAVTFGTAAATIRSTFVPALGLGAFGALLVITLFERARRDWLRRMTTLLDDIPQTFQRMWIALRSRRAEEP
jgi:hypothetical protein